MLKEHYPNFGNSTAIGMTATEAGCAAPRQPPMGQLHEALNRLSKVAIMHREVTDRLCGSRPEADGKGEQCAGDGIFSEIEVVAAEINSIARRIEDDMSRIQDRL